MSCIRRRVYGARNVQQVVPVTGELIGELAFVFSDLLWQYMLSNGEGGNRFVENLTVAVRVTDDAAPFWRFNVPGEYVRIAWFNDPIPNYPIPGPSVTLGTKRESAGLSNGNIVLPYIDLSAKTLDVQAQVSTLQPWNGNAHEAKFIPSDGTATINMEIFASFDILFKPPS